jgi:hypothetical protein
VVSAHRGDVWGKVWSVVFLVIVLGIGGAAAWDLARPGRTPGRELPRVITVAALVGFGLLPLAGWWLVVFAHSGIGILLPLVPAAVFGVLDGGATLRRPRGGR